ncbi:ATP-binding protein [Coraliomargarita sinensis]|uniref:ATP-binding protein n=1 Tax=Coraliomargarita sinensis TaxID=2174842 RepID=UPI001E47A4D0|nr:ATP-binding protein [Coraliomargarita sinensis]
MKTKLTANRIVFIYFVVGSAWIILSTLWLSQEVAESSTIIAIEALKGLAYIVVTTALLWLLCRSWSYQVAEALSKYERSQTQYELYVKNSPISIAVIDRKGKYLEVNEATEKLTGYSFEELQKMSIFEIDATDSKEGTAAVFGEIFTDNYATRDRVIRCKDGSKKIIRVDGVRHMEDRAICFSRDITDRKQNEHKLLMLNAMLRAIRRINKAIVGTPDIDQLIRKICEILIEDREFEHAWIALLDENGKPTHYHDAPELKDAGKLKAFLQAGQLPKCIENTKTKDGLILAAKPIEQCPDFPVMEGLEDCALLGVEFSYANHFGYIALMTSQAAIQDEEEIDLFREVAEDLRFALHSIRAETERKRATEDLLIAKRAAENANRAKDEFLSVMSHELRTPLNPIMGHTSLLQEQIDDPESLDSLQQINRSSEQLLALIEDILFFSQLQDGSKTYQTLPFDLLECSQLALKRSRKQCPKQTIEFENGTDGYDAIPAGTMVAGDCDHIRRIVGELLTNACKYTHEGSIHLRIGQRDLGDGTIEALFEVEDSGIGIEEAVLEKLFDAFTQVDSSHTRRYEGIGLGLAICRKIADISGGSLTAESQPGVGSCFRFRCPLQKVEPAANSGEKTPGTQQAEAPSTGKVLLVEDSSSNALVAQTMLTRWRLKVDLAEHGEAAVEMSRKEKYDLILMDLSMPVMNGFDATQAIRESDSENRETPIIGLTAHVSPDAKEECLKTGMAAFIAKPIRMQTFKDCISEFVRISE